MTWFAAEVARLVEAASARGAAEIADDVLEIGGGVCCFGGQGSWLNCAFGVGMAGPVGPRDVERLVAFFDEHHVAPRVELCPFADESFVRGLADRGFRLLVFENVLVRELSEPLPDALPHGWPEGVTIARLDPADAILAGRFAEVSSSGFHAPGDPPGEALVRSLRRMIGHPAYEHFLAWADGEVIGAASLGVRGPVASLFGATVLGPWRGRGVQAALILRRLVRGRAREARFAVLDSRPGISTERNAARLGFGVAYSKATLERPPRR